MIRLTVVALVFLSTSLLGCGDGNVVVHGTVTLDNQAVSAGEVKFVSSDGPPVREGAVIVDGRFTARVPAGTYKIELYAQRPAGNRTQIGFDGKEEVIQLTEELFPPRFNTQTELTEIIKPGVNTITLNLQSKN